MGQVLVGISSWADPELISTGFYPPELKTAGQRLHFYASRFPIVELDSSYHFLPTRRNLAAWIDATPGDFVFDLKAFSLLTQHPTPLHALPREMRGRAESALNKEGHLYINHLSDDLVKEIWERFEQAVFPLFSAQRLGVVSFQFPTWFHPKPENYAYLKECAERLPHYRLAVEFRTGAWLAEEKENTLQILIQNKLSLVCVDEPRGLRSSVPSLAEVTSKPAIVRFHGRNGANWEKKDIPVNEKYAYLYNDEELKEWVPKIKHMASIAQEVYVIFKNKHLDFAVQNALRLKALLEE